MDPYQKFYDRETGEEIHNNYVHLYHKATTDYLIEKYGNKSSDYAPDIMFYVRSGYS